MAEERGGGGGGGREGFGNIKWSSRSSFSFTCVRSFVSQIRRFRRRREEGGGRREERGQRREQEEEEEEDEEEEEEEQEKRKRKQEQEEMETGEQCATILSGSMCSANFQPLPAHGLKGDGLRGGEGGSR